MIIFLNGCSSAGKSTIAKAIQYLDEKPWLLVGIDTFFQMMPSQYVGFGAKAAEGFHFIAESDEEGPLMRIESGPFGKAVVQSAPKVVQTLARDGHNLIVDEVLFTLEELQSYMEALSDQTVYFVGVMCDVKSLQEREILRGNRAMGLGRDQINRVHQPPITYDLTVDTTNTSAFSCAEQILSFIQQTPTPQAFRQLRQLRSQPDKTVMPPPNGL